MLCIYIGDVCLCFYIFCFMLDNTRYYTSVLLFEIFYRVLPTSIRKNWKKIKIQIALYFIFCHHLEPEFTATTRNFASSISGQKHWFLYLPAAAGPASC